MFVPGKPLSPSVLGNAITNAFVDCQILKPAEKKQKYVYGGMSTGRPVTPPRKQKKK